MSDELKVYPLMLHESAMNKLRAMAYNANSTVEKVIEELVPADVINYRKDELTLIYVHKFQEDIKKEPNLMFQMGLAMRLVHDLTTEIK